LLGPRERERERESWARVGRSLAFGQSVGVGWICWVREREQGRSAVGRRSIGGGQLDLLGPRELGEGRSVVGRRLIGGYWSAGFARERERERDFLPLAFSTFLFYFFFIFFLIKKDKRCVMWVKSRTLDARIALLLHAWLVDLLKQIIWLMHICMLHLA
jgi:hypothetical protein